MHLTCVLHHHWNGCRCERCGTVRDQDHDWHRCRCRRCGLSRHGNHDWQGCICSVCGIERHCWVHGVCTNCGLVCDHTPRPGTDADSGTDLTAHITLHRNCDRCGMKVSRVPGR